MPTGYTESIANGISFKEFALQCSRAFGAMVSLRDEPWDTPIPEKFEVTDYHLKEIEKVQKEIHALESLTSNERTQMRLKELEEANISYEKTKKAYSELREKYQKMLAEVLKWVPPSDSHTELKIFMVKQIQDSMKYDCPPEPYHKKKELEELLEDSVWFSAKLTNLNWYLDYHREAYRKEVESTNKRNTWLKLLRDSLPE